MDHRRLQDIVDLETAGTRHGASAETDEELLAGADQAHERPVAFPDTGVAGPVARPDDRHRG